MLVNVFFPKNASFLSSKKRCFFDVCISFLIVCNKLPHIYWLKRHAFIISQFWGWGVHKRLNWVLCLGSHKAAVKVLIRWHFLDPQILFLAHIVVGQIHFPGIIFARAHSLAGCHTGAMHHSSPGGCLGSLADGLLADSLITCKLTSSKPARESLSSLLKQSLMW